MKSRKAFPMGAAAFATILAAFLPGCENPQGTTPVRADMAPAAPVTRVVGVKAARTTLRKTVEQPGQIVAFETTAMHAKIAGYLRNITVDIGSAVKEGQTMAELWVPEIVSERDQKLALVRQAKSDRAQAEAAVKVADAVVESARARVVEVQAGIKRAEGDLALWQSEAKRAAQLVRDSVVTGSLYDEARNKLQAAEGALDEEKAKILSAQAAVLQSQAAGEKARADLAAAASRVDVSQHEVTRLEALLAYAKINAPFSGIVTQRHFDTGHLTQPDGASEPLFVLMRSDLVTITVDVPEMSAVALKPGAPARVRVQALDGKTFEGHVTRTSWALDPKTRTLRAEVDLPNPDGVLRPGLYAYATIIAEEHPDVLAVPSSALFQKDGQTCCVAVKQGKALRKPLKTGLTDGALTEVREGLEPGDVVVKAYADSLADGQPLELSAVEEIPAKEGKP